MNIKTIINKFAPIGLRKIPRVFHFVWDGGAALPGPYERNIKAWQEMHGRQWGYQLWTFDHGKELVASKYPQLMRQWNTLPRAVQIADLLRYVILHEFGGVYCDLDTRPDDNFNRVIGGSDFVAGYENKPHPSICNAILASVPRHPIMRSMLRYLSHAPEDLSRADTLDGSHVFATTGSLALTPMILANRTRRTRIVGPSAFYPFDWSQKHLCRERFEHSFARHYWASGWYRQGHYHVDAYWEREPEQCGTAPVAACPYKELDGKLTLGYRSADDAGTWVSSWSSEREAVGCVVEGKAE